MSLHGILVSAAFLPILSGAVRAEEIVVEAGNFSRSEEVLIPASIAALPTASAGRMTVVRGRGTGSPSWMDFAVTVEGGLYELRIRCGGNDSRQAGLVSIDGGRPAIILDEPHNPLPLDQPLPADHRERTRLLEQSFREHLVGKVELSAGRHRVRVQHAGLPGRSSSFGFDFLKLTSVAESKAPRLEVGNQRELLGGSRSPEKKPLELHLLRSYRFWGPDERPALALLVWNRNPTRAEGAVTIEVRSLDRTEKVRRVVSQPVRLERGSTLIRAVTFETQSLPRGRYTIEARLRLKGGDTLSDSVTIRLVALNTPGWAKRARVDWCNYDLGMDLNQTLARLGNLVAGGVNVIINSNVGDWLGEEGISYPFRGGEEKFRTFLDTIHKLGACHLMYHSAITVHEHFYYEHKEFWGGRKPFYHCAWLSIYPDSHRWGKGQRPVGSARSSPGAG